VKGAAQQIDDPEQEARAANLELRPWAGGEKPYFVRITPTSASGRRIPRGQFDFEQIHEPLMVSVTDEEEIDFLRRTLPRTS
jgi:hypothetical protein